MTKENKEKMLDALFALSDVMCYELYKMSISSEHYCGDWNCPNLRDFSKIEGWFNEIFDHTKIHRKDSLDCLKKVVHFHFLLSQDSKCVDYVRDLISLMLFTDSNVLLRELSGKTITDVDLTTRAMRIFLFLIPDTGDADESVWDLPDYLLNSKKLQDFCRHKVLMLNQDLDWTSSLKSKLDRFCKQVSTYLADKELDI